MKEEKKIMHNAEGPGLELKSEDSIRAKWLVSLSLALVVFIEIFPMEAGLANIAILTGSFLVWLALKLTSLTLVLLRS